MKNLTLVVTCLFLLSYQNICVSQAVSSDTAGAPNGAVTAGGILAKCAGDFKFFAGLAELKLKKDKAYQEQYQTFARLFQIYANTATNLLPQEEVLKIIHNEFEDRDAYFEIHGSEYITYRDTTTRSCGEQYKFIKGYYGVLKGF